MSIETPRQAGTFTEPDSSDAALQAPSPPWLAVALSGAEVAYFLREDEVAVDPLFQFLERNALRIEFDMSAHWPRIRTLMARYDRMDLSDACVVVMSERYRRCQVLTVDRKDFSVYRRNDRQVIDFVAPPTR